VSPFSTEAAVRLKFGLTDSALIPQTLVAQSIDDAHAELLESLDPACDTQGPPAALVLGETLLAGAHLFRSLASRDAFDQQRITIGGQRIEEGARFASLMAVASLTEDRAWVLLAPFLKACPVRNAAWTTASTPVLGESN